MLNALFPEVKWNEIKSVGFDLDGTLYDEFVFIQQAYRAILLEYAEYFEYIDIPYRYMLGRWLEKGSSFNRIFEETFDLFVVGSLTKATFIEGAIEIFRNVKPNLVLSSRNRYFLEFFKENYDIFLVTDGFSSLQKRKFLALGLDRFFSSERVVFTGELGKEFFKPHCLAYELLGIQFPHAAVIYFGDRELDREFACRLGLNFQLVYNMVSR